MIDKQLMAVNISSKASNPIIHRHNIGIEGMNQIIKALSGEISPQVDTSISALNVLIPSSG